MSAFSSFRRFQFLLSSMKAWWIWPVRSAATEFASSGIVRTITSSTWGSPFLK